MNNTEVEIEKVLEILLEGAKQKGLKLVKTPEDAFELASEDGEDNDYLVAAGGLLGLIAVAISNDEDKFKAGFAYLDEQAVPQIIQ